MKVLLDECVDPKARHFFSNNFDVTHVKDLGWLGIKNGELVAKANEKFDALFTIDSSMRHQTSLKNLSLFVVVAEGHFRSVDSYKDPINKFEQVAATLEKGAYHRLSKTQEPDRGMDF